MTPDEARREVDAMLAVGRTLAAVRDAEPSALGLLTALGYGVEGGDGTSPEDGQARIGYPGEAMHAGPSEADRRQARELEAPRPKPEPAPAPILDEHAEAVARFEDGAREAGLSADGYAAAVAEAGGKRHTDLTVAELDAATLALLDPGTVAALNEQGFVARVGSAVRNAPEKSRERAHAKATAAAMVTFVGEALDRVRLALDRAAGLPIPPAAADGPDA